MAAAEADQQAGEAVLAAAVAAYQDLLGRRLLAGYALGSLAHGGFSELVSDVDLGLIVADPAQLGDRRAIGRVASSVWASGPELARRLSVFWGTPATLRGQARGGRFPPLDRLDLLEYGRLVAGQDAREGLARPGRDELLVAGAEFALRNLAGQWPGLPSRPAGPSGQPASHSGQPAGPPLRPAGLPDVLAALARWRPRPPGTVAEVRDPALLVARGPRRLTKVVLFPVRFSYTAATGEVGTNARAAEHYLASRPAPAAGLVSAALGWRRQPPADPGQAAALLERELIPLYLGYLDDHIERLQEVGASALASRFRRWRARLLA
ncbi:MAG TPA: hypothetical protein VH637_15230 [Streptosporangiaceae bacterium]|jgi:hypothetical protein